MVEVVIRTSDHRDTSRIEYLGYQDDSIMKMCVFFQGAVKWNMK